MNDIDSGVQIQCLSDRYWLVGVVELHTDSRGTGVSCFDLELAIEVSHLLAHIKLMYREIRNADLVPRLKAHWAPDAARDEGRSPVPSILVCGLARVGL